MRPKDTIRNGRRSTLGKIVIGAMISMLVMILGIASVAGLIIRNVINEDSTGYVVVIVLLLSSIMGCSFVIKKEREGAFGISVLVGMVYSIMLLLITALGFGDGYRGVPVTILVIVSGCIITVIARKDRTKTGDVRRNRK